jgi:hypothetical protein
LGVRRIPIVLAAVVFGAVAGAGSAGETASRGLDSARLYVTGASHALGGTGGIRIRYEQRQTDDAAAAIAIYVPKGYQVATGHAPATNLGKAAATILATDLRAAVPAMGTVDVAAADEFAEQAAACTGSATHDAVWALRLDVAGTPLVVPVLVDATVDGPLAEVAAARVVLCFQPGDLPPGTPGRAPLGAKVVSVELTSSAFVNPPTAGAHRWRASVAPYAQSSSERNVGGSVEVQAVVALPATLALTIRPRKTPRAETHTIAYRGRLRANGAGVAHARVDVLRGRTAPAAKKFRTQTTDEQGAFAGSFAVTKRRRAEPLHLLARASAAHQDLGPAECVQVDLPPLATDQLPCVGATAGAIELTSRSLALRVPATPRRKR